MAIDEKDNHILILTTDIHLPRRIGQAVFNAYEGEFDFNYDKEGYFVRVNWSRNDWRKNCSPLYGTAHI